jgi:hypothetical protein
VGMGGGAAMRGRRTKAPPAANSTMTPATTAAMRQGNPRLLG